MSTEVTDEQTEKTPAEWLERARELLRSALDDGASDDIITVEEALMCLYLSAGETPRTIVLDAAGYVKAVKRREKDEGLCSTHGSPFYRL